MDIKATAHIKSDRSEIRIEIWNWDNWTPDKSGIPANLTDELEQRGYINTNDMLHGYRLTTEAANGPTEMAWLKSKNISLGQGGFYD